MTGRLRSLVANQATPGPWKFHDSSDQRGRKGEFRAPSPYNGFMLVGPWTNDTDARLIALVPEMALLLADMADELGKWSQYRTGSLLARFRELEERV